MFCLFLGLSLSLLAHGANGQSQAAVLALHCRLQEWLAIKPILDNYTFTQGMSKWLPLPNRKICSITFGTPKQRGTKSEVKTSARGHHDAPRGP